MGALHGPPAANQRIKERSRLSVDRKLLGYSFWAAAGKTVKRRVAKKAIATMKGRVRRLADTPRIFADLNEWIRHRLRAIHLKQWKRGATIFRELRARGLSEPKAATVARNGRRWWRNSAKLINLAFPISYFDRLGVPRLAA